MSHSRKSFSTSASRSIHSNLNLVDENEIFNEESNPPTTPIIGTDTDTATPTKESKSLVFKEYFTKTPLGNNIFKVQCNFCTTSFTMKKGGGYGTFNRHMEKNHPTKLGIDVSQKQLTGNSSSNPTDVFHFDQNTWKNELAKCISVQHLPFNHAENVNFINFCQKALNPAAKKVSRNTIKRTIMKLFKEGQINLRNYFINFNGKFSICCDIWSDHWQTHSYMGVTCHWIDENYFLQKRLLAYRVFDDQHSARNISMLLTIIFQEYGLINKIFSISFDNASSNTASIPELERSCKPAFGGKFFHVRCAAHVLNLCVQDGLRNLSDTLDYIRVAINFIWGHSSVKKEWAQFCKENGKRPKKFPRDIPTRWNSTYRLLTNCFEYKDLLSNFLALKYSKFYFETEVWDRLLKILEMLSVFNIATERLSGVYYSTSHLIVPECVNIAYTLNAMHGDPNLNNVSIFMKMKWCKYFKHIPLINLVAAVFDPRIKLDGLEEYLNTYYQCIRFDNLNLGSEIFSQDLTQLISLSHEINEIKVEQIMLEVKTQILELLTESSASLATSSSSGSSTQPLDRGKSMMSPAELMMQERLKRPKTTYNSSLELDLYFSHVFNTAAYVNNEFDILDWWKQHAHQFPVLASIVRGILGSPVSTVAVEQAFSAGGNILTETRSVLSPESLEAQVCLDDWTKAETRTQGQAHLADYDQFDLSSEGTQTGDSGSGNE